MSDMLKRQLHSIAKKEENFLGRAENAFLRDTVAPVMDKIESKIPEKIRETLNAAFYSGFRLVFEHGDKIIEKSYNKGKLELKHDVNNYAVDKLMSRKTLDTLDRDANITAIKNASISVVEGGALGAFGIGLPDIPVLIGLIVKTIYEISISYGVDYKSDKEKYFILLIICGAMAKGEDQRTFNHQTDSFAASLEREEEPVFDLERMMRITSKILSEAMLTAKFIQGFAVVGVIGAAVNYRIIRKISTYAGLKYKKRYIHKKITEGRGEKQVD
ncbi:EcsC family protein [Parasporobacterium paucivorans]|uniref:EcsC protein family protein n=1 Tax=Parasporobacterium paucivorans DSM 15970 TaxID=1122934 RepID=A0A1M6E734_9FIRM|nr:EcsC family protein [Parasporobacterium paucivorans]SHI81189.1 EcsC protein family protein [Parasporobacterium paucivorans DSM 15970]